ncbi:hypothetical protein AB1Y20_014384 [Prymnesium parvum]|uniref:Transmembrane protein n=1 Tax=Prymnesium parvum TaxID=97485 RepID=A0AB34IGG6_PRYPA
MDSPPPRPPIASTIEQHVLSHVLGSLIAWALGLLGYMLFLLWKDYISLIASAFLLSQALHRPRAALVDWAEGLRAPSAPRLYVRLLGAAVSPAKLLFKLTAIPSLVQLALLLALELLHNVAPLLSIVTPLALGVLLVGGLVCLMDRRLLGFNRWVSDEVVAATAVLLTLCFVLTFITTVIAIRSVLELRELVVAVSSWMGSIAPAAAGAFTDLANSGLELSISSLGKLDGSEHKWAGVLLHLLGEVRTASNGTAVVQSTFVKIRQMYPDAAWLSAEDFGKLVLWLSGDPFLSSTWAAAQPLRWAAPINNTAAAPHAQLSASEVIGIVWRQLQEFQTREEMMQSLQSWGGGLGTSTLQLLASALGMLMRLLNFALMFGVSGIVLATMTFSMLCMKTDALTYMMNLVTPHAIVEKQRVRETVDAVLTLPFSDSARNATLTLIIYKALSMPYAHLAALGVIVFTIFPLTYPWVVCTPWCVAYLVVLGGGADTARGVLLLAALVASLSGTSRTAQRLYDATRIGEYVIGFSLVLGVYMFGIQGVLFGPTLVCGAKLCSDMGTAIIRHAEGLTTPAVPNVSNGDFSSQTSGEWRADAAAAEATSNHSHLLGRAMRRLSFFSPPTHSRPASVARDTPAAFGASAATPAPHKSAAAAAERVQCAVRLGAARVRVCSRADVSWAHFLRLVAERLADATAVHVPVVGLRALDGTLVAAVSDIAPLEELIAETSRPITGHEALSVSSREPNESSASPVDRPAVSLKSGAVELRAAKPTPDGACSAEPIESAHTAADCYDSDGSACFTPSVDGLDGKPTHRDQQFSPVGAKSSNVAATVSSHCSRRTNSRTVSS